MYVMAQVRCFFLKKKKMEKLELYYLWFILEIYRVGRDHAWDKESKILADKLDKFLSKKKKKKKL